jgi:dTDP-4-amino-4,6-dideoxygalactose transaminase
MEWSTELADSYRAIVPLNDLSRSWIANNPEVQEAVRRVLSSGWYVLGPETAAFEQQLAEFLGCEHVFGVASGTDALRIALLSVGCENGSEVVCAANAGGYAAVAATSIGSGLVYADVDPASLVLTPETVLAAIGPDTRAVVVTHLYGNVADAPAIVAACHERGIAVVEDCAQSLGASLGGVRVGTFGDVAALSFYPTKNLGAAGDGGAIATNDPGIARAVVELRQYGWTGKYQIDRKHGINSRLDELQAAILCVGLNLVDELSERRREIVRRYRDALSMPSVQLVSGETKSFVAHLAVLRCSDRATVMDRLRAAGISTAIHYPIPDHRQRALPAAVRQTELTVTEQACREVLSLPCFPEMDPVELERVSSAIGLADET